MSGLRVKFKLRDVFYPSPVEVLCALHGEESLDGEILTPTSNGEEDFLVVQIRGLSEPVLIPRRKAVEVSLDAAVEVTAARGGKNRRTV